MSKKDFGTELAHRFVEASISGRALANVRMLNSISTVFVNHAAPEEHIEFTFIMGITTNGLDEEGRELPPSSYGVAVNIERLDDYCIHYETVSVPVSRLPDIQHDNYRYVFKIPYGNQFISYPSSLLRAIASRNKECIVDVQNFRGTAEEVGLSIHQMFIKIALFQGQLERNTVTTQSLH